MKQLAKYFLVLFITSLILSLPSLVRAQEDLDAETTEAIFDVQSYAQDIRQLTIQYRGELEEYRTIEREYEINKQQYYQLQTLDSLEKAVRATQEAMVIRAKVLRTYIRLLRFHLLSQTGIELPEKQTTDQDLLSTLSKIEQHQQVFNEALDKPAIADAALEFKELFAEIEYISYRTLSLLAVGKLQTAHDKAIVLKQDMEVQLATAGGALKQAERKRSFAETDRLLGSLKANFDQIEVNLAKDSNSRSSGSYRSTVESLNKIYSALMRSLRFLEELLKT